jgi:hypothetical protein
MDTDVVIAEFTQEHNDQMPKMPNENVEGLGK